MSYDALNRLVGTQILDTQVTLLTFAYNSIGNLLQANGTQNITFIYAGNQTHAPSRIVIV